MAKKKKLVKLNYEDLLVRLEQDIANYRAAKNPDTMKCLKETCKLIVANTVNPTTPPPPPTPKS